MKPDSVIKVDLEEEALHPYTHHLKFISVTRGPGRSQNQFLSSQLKKKYKVLSTKKERLVEVKVDTYDVSGVK